MDLHPGGALSTAQLAAYERDGYVRLPGFASNDTCARMLEEVVAIVRAADAGTSVDPALVLPEANLAGATGTPEALASKVFKLHRLGTFEAFAHDPQVVSLLEALVGPALDCFLSQFIFKNPGAWGQPWHQDSYYFPFTPARPIAGVWLAVTEATLENGCLHVLPGSHREPVHDHEPDRRPGANYGYVEIVDHRMDGAVPVLMDAGDLLLFDSHLMHRSTDNESQGVRAAMVYHYCTAGTVEDRPGLVNDFVRVSPREDAMD